MAEIGYRLAFDDPAYFSRRFRAVRGLTPSDYRAQFSG
ncbi:AraC family transcriptional regulator [Paenirhodobacter huangdaonensis]|nr:AraC family transcriptional regulator [Sinirhodobacter huangdaonensis]